MSSISESIRIVCETPEQTIELGRRIGMLSASGTVVSLQGSLGSGKTVIAKGIAQALGITEAIVSST
ncbi:MAG: tRNA (adenosine(37)-N6)-threonylcarbamoyltransferase complex ATPase subunit type 1 TsaE, partial [Sphaerochaetaceae bacterium]